MCSYFLVDACKTFFFFFFFTVHSINQLIPPIILLKEKEGIFGQVHLDTKKVQISSNHINLALPKIPHAFDSGSWPAIFFIHKIGPRFISLLYCVIGL